MLHRRLRLSLLALALFPAGACLRVPGDMSENPGTRSAPSTAQEVLDRHIDAIGGADPLAALSRRTVEARMVFRPQEGCEEGDETCLSEQKTGTFLLRSTAAGRLYRRTVVGEIVEERGFDGKTGWRLQNGVLVLEDEGETARSREDATLHWYLGLADRGVQVTLQPSRDEDSDGKARTLDGLHWTVEGGHVPPKTLWFDRQTGLLREEIIEEAVGDQALKQTIVYDDYRAVDDVLVPHLIRLQQELDDRTQLVEFVTQRVDHGKFDTKLFDVPDLPPPKPQADERLAALADTRDAAAAQPKDAGAAIGHARAAFAAGHFEDAIAAARATLKLDTKEPEALFILARSLLLKGDLRGANKILARAGKAGVKGEAIALQRAWIASRQRDYGQMARAFDKAGQPVLAGRYRAFAGRPFGVTMPGKLCTATVPLAIRVPLAAVEVQVGGQVILAMIDTGAQDVILADDLAQQIGVVEQAQSPVPGGGKIGHGQLMELAIGDVKIRNIPVDVFPAASITDMAGDASGRVKAVIGARLLQQFQPTLDVVAGTLDLRQRNKACKAELARNRQGTSVKFWLHESHYLYVRASLDQAEGMFLVNTGMRGAALTGTQLAFAHAGIGTPPLRANETPMVSVPKVTLAQDVFVETVPAAYGIPEQTETSDGFRLDGMIGLDVLAKYRWTIDFDEQQFYFQPSRAPSGGS